MQTESEDSTGIPVAPPSPRFPRRTLLLAVVTLTFLSLAACFAWWNWQGRRALEAELEASNAELVAVKAELESLRSQQRAEEVARRGRRRARRDTLVAMRQQRLRERNGQDSGEPDEADPWEGIRQVGEGTYEIAPEATEYAQSHQDVLAQQARVVPSLGPDGLPRGFKVFSITRDSALWKMGLLNNDILLSINGKALSSTEEALELYASLRGMAEFEIGIERNGAPMTLYYSVQ